MEETGEFYMVMKLLTEVAIHAPSGGEIHSGEIRGLKGYVPVYRTLNEALEASQDGKYSISRITIGEGI